MWGMRYQIWGIWYQIRIMGYQIGTPPCSHLAHSWTLHLASAPIWPQTLPRFLSAPTPLLPPFGQWSRLAPLPLPISSLLPSVFTHPAFICPLIWPPMSAHPHLAKIGYPTYVHFKCSFQSHLMWVEAISLDPLHPKIIFFTSRGKIPKTVEKQPHFHQWGDRIVTNEKNPIRLSERFQSVSPTRATGSAADTIFGM